jgi:hypothetical protein
VYVLVCVIVYVPSGGIFHVPLSNCDCSLGELESPFWVVALPGFLSHTGWLFPSRDGSCHLRGSLASLKHPHPSTTFLRETPFPAFDVTAKFSLLPNSRDYGFFLCVCIADRDLCLTLKTKTTKKTPNTWKMQAGKSQVQ